MTMATPIRKKRNFKALQLDVSQPAKPKEPDPLPVRAAPPVVAAGKGKKRPPPMTLNAPKIGVSNAVQDPDGNLLTPAGGLSVPSTNARRNTYHTTLSNTLANLDMNAETHYDLRNEDLKDLQELGQGNGGSVKKVEHTPTNTIMAKKASLFSLLDLRFLELPSRSSSLMQSPPCGSRFSANFTLCMTVIRHTLSPSMALSFLILISAFAWSSWTRVLSMGFTRKSVPSISTLSPKLHWPCSRA